jgi:predicted O-linked N-acetylglucosamine transferase (SPINDLY family)
MVDLVGHSGNTRLLALARKPAPVQATYLGYANTTGVRQIDYRITDALADPPGMTEGLHTEQLVRLPRTAWCYSPPSDSLNIVRTRREAGAPVTFGCFNILSKVNEEVIKLWAKILHAVPGSRLMLKSRAKEEPTGILAMLEAQGIVRDRIDALGRVPSFVDHLKLYNQMDICLDPFPYNGTTTTCEAMWMGVPVVALEGITHASRVGVSLLTNVGLPELVGKTAEDYVRIGIDLARDEARMRALQMGLRERMKSSPLMDGVALTREMETAYRQMWRQYCARPDSD